MTTVSIRRSDGDYAALDSSVVDTLKAELDRVKAAYGPNFHRLEETKKKYDPKNLFRINQNIRPTP